ncbi:MAG: DNA-binding response regulator [Firmicutes bacterium HGW-Firmicutes-15]|nr:MAG: DNA-binding response regulator [Firmicutes bacterium HGW-Firmicutes-15]
MKHIFVVDDEKNIRDLIKKYLEKEGYIVTPFSGEQNLLPEIERIHPDLVVMDITLPGRDGLELCKEIRKSSDTPIIFVSARDEEFDRVLGLELGGDDYLTKPFSPRELVARIKNVFKRLDKSIQQVEEIKLKDIILYPGRRYMEKDGAEIKLTAKEYELFAFLLNNKNRSFTREYLIEKVWGYDYIGEARIVDDLVKRIRKKIHASESIVEITTVWGYGYRLDD